MKFICDRDVILNNISSAQDIISSKTSISILSNIYIKASDGMLNIKATDTKISYETSIPVVIEEEGETTLFLNKLIGLLRLVPEGSINFSETEGEMLIKPEKKRVKFKLNTMSPDKFPVLPHMDDDKFFDISQSDFVDMVKNTIFSVSDDEARYYMNGVFLEKAEDKLLMVATDARRLSYVSIPAGGIPDFESIIIPPKILQIVTNISTGEGNMKVAVDEKKMYLKINSFSLTSNLIDGKFPNFKRIIPENQVKEIIVNREELAKAAKRVELLTELKTNLLFFNIKNNTMTIKSKENDYGEAEEVIDCQYDSDDEINFILTGNYIDTPLRIIKESEIKLGYTNTATPITLNSSPSSNAFHIIMSIKPENA